MLTCWQLVRFVLVLLQVHGNVVLNNSISADNGAGPLQHVVNGKDTGGCGHGAAHLACTPSMHAWHARLACTPGLHMRQHSSACVPMPASLPLLAWPLRTWPC